MPPRHCCLFIVFVLHAGSACSAAEPPRKPGNAPAQTKQPLVDIHGDPLPPGALARLGTTRLRHKDRIFSLGFSADGTILVSGGKDCMLTCWDVATGRPLRQIPFVDYKSDIFPSLSHDGTTLAVPAKGNAIRLIDVATGKEIHRFSQEDLHWAGLDFSWSPLTLSPDGKALVVYRGGSPGCIALWETASGRRLRLFSRVAENGVDRVALSPDGKALAVLDVDRQEKKGQLRFWDVATGAEIRSFAVSPSEIREFQFLPDGKSLIASDLPFAGSLLRRFDAANGKCLCVYKGLDNKVNGFALSRDGKRLCAVNGEQACLWEVTSGALVWRLPFHSGQENVALPTVAFAPDGRTLALSRRRVVVFLDALTGKEKRGFPGHEAPIQCVAFSPTRPQLLSAGEGTAVWVWDRATGNAALPLERPLAAKKPSQEEAIYPAFEPVWTACACSAEGQTVAVLWPWRPIQVWDTVAGKLLHQLESDRAQHCLAYSPGGDMLASAGKDGIVRLWSLSKGREVRRLTWHRMVGADTRAQGRLAAVAFSPDGKSVAAAGHVADGSLSVPLIRLWEVETGLLRMAIRPRGGRTSKDPEGLGTGAELFDFWTCSLAFSPDGSILATGGLRGATLWDASTGKELRHCAGRQILGRTFAFTPDGRLLAAGKEDGDVRFWDVATGTVKGDFSAHEGAVTALAFSQDGKCLATGGFDTTVLVWDMAKLPIRTEGARPGVYPAKLAGLWADLAGTDGLKAYAARGQLIARADEAVAFLTGKLRAATADRDGPPLRALRAVEVLEHLATPAARQLLRDLAAGPPEARLTREARASLQRLGRRPR